jgi:Xaa-Pro dipeptidase
LSRLQVIIRQADLDAIALVPGYNLQYLTGVAFMMTERPMVAFIPASGEGAVVVPQLELDHLHETGFPAQFFAWADADGYEDAFRQAMAALGLRDKRIGVEGFKMRFREGQVIAGMGATVVDAEAPLVDLRIIKSAEEIENHRRAVQISETALGQLLEHLKLGMTERQIARRLSELQAELGGEADAFGPTVLIGARSALPHGNPGDTPLKNGDVLLIDYGTRVNGYVSDITRTFVVGQPTERFRQFYATVLAANEAGRQTARPGVSGEDIDRATANVLRDGGLGDYIKHRTGHGIGLDVHEHPNITIGDTRPLAPGMAFTIEPGLYAAGEFGIRIEDNVVVTADGAESLTTFPRDLTILELT